MTVLSLSMSNIEAGSPPLNKGIDMKKYRVKVTEKHSDYVWVDAHSSDEAERLAIQDAECEFECIYDCEIVSAEETT